MLVLSRKPGEKIMIGNDVVLTILEVRGDNVKLGVQAPRSIAIHREEIYEELRRSNQQAASPQAAKALDVLGKKSLTKPSNTVLPKKSK